MGKAKTYIEVLSTSLELFNEFGVESVSVYKVAEHVGISTGNLTYHFKRKKDLVETHMEVFETELTQLIENFPRGSKSPAEYLDAYLRMLKLSWGYRFLFNSAQYILQSELVDLSSYQRLISHIASTFERHVQTHIERGRMKPIPPPYNIEMLVDCVWWQWLGWLRVNQLRSPEDHVSFEDITINVIEHFHFLIKPNLKSGLNRQIRKVIEAQIAAGRH